mmetsp:Transcript_59413/g.181253  ORF Transcript_59413/g.181253 Transcript_59413/m.181253 type:complete len:272 (-) Transcript_59413:183-998(-)
MKTTSATMIAPGRTSLANLRSSRERVSGIEKPGSPEGIGPMTLIGCNHSYPSEPATCALKYLAKTQVAAIKSNSLKSLTNFKALTFFSLLAFMRNAKQRTLSTVVAWFRYHKYPTWSRTTLTMPPLTQAGRPNIGTTWDNMIKYALAVMKPLSAGRDRKRTRNASLQTPMRKMKRPTSSVMMLPTCVRKSMSSPYWASCSPVSRLTSPPVPTEACKQVPNMEYTMGGIIQLYGPLIKLTLHKSAWASDCPIRTAPRVRPPDTSGSRDSRTG